MTCTLFGRWEICRDGANHYFRGSIKPVCGVSASSTGEPPPRKIICGSKCAYDAKLHCQKCRAANAERWRKGGA